MKITRFFVMAGLAWVAWRAFQHSPELGPGTAVEWWFNPETNQLMFAPGVIPPGPGFREPSEVEWATYGAGAPVSGGVL